MALKRAKITGSIIAALFSRLTLALATANLKKYFFRRPRGLRSKRSDQWILEGTRP